jgi:DNA-binding transcriptional MerR regulator
MRVRELRERSGVSIPSIKYYIREGILQPGAATHPNQAEYGDEHLRRLALIRALREVAGLSIATIKDVLAAAGAPSMGTVTAIGRAMDALAPDGHELSAREDGLSRRLAARLRAEGWEFRETSGSFRALTEALARGCEAFAMEADPESVMMYAGPAMEIARREFADDSVGTLDEGEESIAWAVLGTVMFEPVILALRRLAHEHLALASLPEEDRLQILAEGAWEAAGASPAASPRRVD